MPSLSARYSVPFPRLRYGLSALGAVYVPYTSRPQLFQAPRNGDSCPVVNRVVSQRRCHHPGDARLQGRWLEWEHQSQRIDLRLPGISIGPGPTNMVQLWHGKMANRGESFFDTLEKIHINRRG